MSLFELRSYAMPGDGLKPLLQLLNTCISFIFLISCPTSRVGVVFSTVSLLDRAKWFFMLSCAILPTQSGLPGNSLVSRHHHVHALSLMPWRRRGHGGDGILSTQKVKPQLYRTENVHDLLQSRVFARSLPIPGKILS